jgi:hypothetical protein
MDYSAPMLASFEALPDMLTAKDLEAVLQAPDHALAGRALASSPDRCMERAPSANRAPKK